MKWHLALGLLLILEATVISGLNKKEDVKTAPSKDNAGSLEKGKTVDNPAKGQTKPPVQSTTPSPNADLPTPPTIAKDSGAAAGSRSEVKKEAPAASPTQSAQPEAKGDGKSTVGSNQAAAAAAAAALSEKAGLDKVKSARILVVMPLPFYSHTQNYMPIFKALAKRGHNITMVSPYPQKNPLPNWEDIVTENVLEKMLASMPTRDFTEMSQSFFFKLAGILFFSEQSVKLMGDMPEVMELYRDNSREYDLVFIETQFVQEVLLAFGWKYKAPVISLYPSYIVPELAYYTGNPVFTTNYVPNMALPSSNEMSLYQRFENTAFAILKIFLYNGIHLPKMDSYMKQYFPSDDRPYIADLLFNVSFTLLDSNPVLTYPYPRANNMREFLGVNTKPDTPLSPELQGILDGADKEGVVLFTLGSHYQTSTLKPHILQSILHAFSKIPQKVIMKWDKDEPPPNLPSNVHTVKWVPQAGILRHRNCRAFFTHTGVHGVMEAMDHAVPLISFPLFADQEFYGTWAEKNGVGRQIDHRTITPEIAEAVVKDVVNNPKYKENAVAVSVMIKDVPQPTIDEVVYWVEHVIRTKGARHLRPGSLNLWWYQRFGFDVLAVCIALISVTIWVTISFLKCLCSICRRKKKTTDKEKAQLKSKKQN